jgi:hypothetical protein
VDHARAGQASEPSRQDGLGLVAGARLDHPVILPHSRWTRSTAPGRPSHPSVR